VAAVVGTASGVAFVRRQGVLADPMIDLRLFQRPRFRAAVLGNMAMMFTFAGTLFFLTQYLQVVGEMSPLRAGLVLVPGLGGSIVATLAAAPLARRWSTAIVVGSGMAIVGAGLLVLAGVSAHGDAARVALAFALLGAGTNLTASLLVESILSSLPPAKAGAGSAVSETGVELGIALGTALLGTVVLAVYRAGLDDAILPGVDAAALGEARESLGGALSAAEDLDASTAERLLDVARASFTDGVRIASLAAAVLVLVAAAVTARTLSRRSGDDEVEPVPAIAG
jgi:DHA2 family multidrug resistance protein-like MFS transporter